MSAYAGSSLVVQWLSSSGTATLTGDFRTFSYTPAVDLYEQSAGADAAKTYLPGIKSGNCSFGAVMQASGTTLTNALVEGTEGTIYVGPEGTVAGKQKLTIPAIAGGVTYNIPYNNVVEVSVSWTQNGSRTDGVWA